LPDFGAALFCAMFYSLDNPRVTASCFVLFFGQSTVTRTCSAKE